MPEDTAQAAEPSVSDDGETPKDSKGSTLPEARKALEGMDTSQPTDRPGPPTAPSPDQLPVGVYRTTPEGRFLYVNQAMARIFGYPDRESLEATSAGDHYKDPEDRAQWMAQVLQSGSVRRHEIEIVRGDGSTAWISHTARVVRDDDGQPLWFEGIVEDAGELRHLREERERKARMLSLLEEVATAANATSDPEEIFRLVLERVCDFAGWPVGHVYHTSETDPDVLWPSSLWHLDDRDRFARLVDVTTVNAFPRGVGLPGRVLETGEAVWIPDLTAESGFVRARQELELGVRGGFAFPVLAGDEVVAVLEFFSVEVSEPGRDFLNLTERMGAIVGRVVERARATKEVRRLHGNLEDRVEERTAELAASVQELEAFAYAVSHDLRTPLRALDGFSKALLEDYGDRLDQTGKDYLDRVRGASQRMSDLIDDLLRLSRISRRSLEREIVDLSRLAEDVVRELAEAEPNRSVTVDIQKKIVGVGDPALLRVVLENLLGNAWKFTSGKGDPRIEVEGRSDEGEQIVQIRDNGAGFDPEYADKLFAPFQRLHRQDEFPGTGIGLATVKRIIRRHGGRVWADGEPGVGATFSFALPRRRSAMDTPGEPEDDTGDVR